MENKIKSYKIYVEYDNGDVEQLFDMPEGMNQDIEEYIEIINKQE